jgi:hypothetical protein
VKRLLAFIDRSSAEIVGILAYLAILSAIVVASMLLRAIGEARDAMDEQSRLSYLLSRCYDDPCLFNEMVLERSPYWWAQNEICSSVVENRTTVVYTGNAIGKDYAVGGIVPWWLYTRADSLVIVTGPSQTLLGSVTWKEIRRALEGARFPMGAKTSVGVKASPQTVTLPGIGWGALGYSTTNVERASGQHARKLLVIIEEASGVEDEVWDAIDSLKYTRLLAIGNPIRAEGRFVDLIRQADRDRQDGIPPNRRVNAIRISSRQSPHAELEESPYGLADRTWLESMERQYGRDSLWVKSHIDAIVPTISSDVLIPESWLDLAMATVRPAGRFADSRAGRKRIACDLSEGVGRDSICIIVGDNLGVLEVVVDNTMSMEAAAKKIADLARKWQVEHDAISYDKQGIGKSFANKLARVGILTATGYSGEQSARSKDFSNARTEGAFSLRNRLDPHWADDPKSRPGIVQPAFSLSALGPHWQRAREELKTLRYDLVGRRTRLILKEDHAEVLGHSPDICDTLIQLRAIG